MSRSLSWEAAELGPVVLVRDGEPVLGDRVLAALLVQARAVDPEVEVSRLAAATYEAGQLTWLASPSLFGERRLVIVEGAEAMNDSFLTECLAYLEAPADDVWLVVRHGGGNRGKRLLDALGRTGTVVACEAVKRESDKVEFVRGDFRRAGRRIDQEAVQALVDAVG
ncbi:MAG: DNA polymerase III subunit delta, partial [Actinobacteria bacterium]|nr:DNA polymerase III subunit delta [Actinomycetota bacterium]